MGGTGVRGGRFVTLVAGLGAALVVAAVALGVWLYLGQERAIADLRRENAALVEQARQAQDEAQAAQSAGAQLQEQLVKARAETEETATQRSKLAGELTTAQREAQAARRDGAELRVANDRLNTRLSDASKKMGKARVRAELLNDFVVVGLAASQGKASQQQGIDVVRRVLALEDPIVDRLIANADGRGDPLEAGAELFAYLSQSIVDALK